MHRHFGINSQMCSWSGTPGLAVFPLPRSIRSAPPLCPASPATAVGPLRHRCAGVRPSLCPGGGPVVQYTPGERHQLQFCEIVSTRLTATCAPCSGRQQHAVAHGAFVEATFCLSPNVALQRMVALLTPVFLLSLPVLPPSFLFPSLLPPPSAACRRRVPPSLPFVVLPARRLSFPLLSPSPPSRCLVLYRLRPGTI